MPRRFLSLTPQLTTIFFHVHFLPQVPPPLKHGTFRLATARLYILSPIRYGHVNVLIVNSNTRKKSFATLPISYHHSHSPVTTPCCNGLRKQLQAPAPQVRPSLSLHCFAFYGEVIVLLLEFNSLIKSFFFPTFNEFIYLGFDSSKINPIIFYV